MPKKTVTKPKATKVRVEGDSVVYQLTALTEVRFKRLGDKWRPLLEDVMYLLATPDAMVNRMRKEMAAAGYPT